MPEIHPISVERYGSKQLLPISSWSFTAERHLVHLFAAEYAHAVHHFPIVFAKQQQVDSFALLGLQPGKNLFLDKKHQWQAKYVPAVFRRYPFVMARVNPDKNDYALCIDEESGLVGDSGGQPFYDKDGKQSEMLEKALKFASECQKQFLVGQRFIALLEELDLLSSLNINLQGKEKTLKLEGLLRIDEERLNALPDVDFLKLRSKGALPLIYAHFFSLRNIELLVSKLFGPSAQQPAEEKLPDSFSF